MPRPASGYRNRAGQPVPGTHDPLNQFKQAGGLIQWAYAQGRKGVPLYDKTAIDIGSAVHHMAELDLKGRPEREIEAYLHQCLSAPEHLQKAWASFEAFREWRQKCNVRAIATETSMVSEEFQYGGTQDVIALINNGIGLIDFKTCNKPAVYPEMLYAMAAHGQLWNENHPDQPITSYHLILLPKNGDSFEHHFFDDLLRQWEIFKLLLEAYRLTMNPKAAPQAKPAKNWEPLRKQLQDSLQHEQAKLAAKPRVRVKAINVIHASMGELMRAYQHIPEVS